MTQKHTFEYIKDQISDMGHILHSKKYENSHTNLLIESPEGKLFKMRWSNFQQGQRCPTRKGKTYGGYSYRFIKNEIKNAGFTLLSKKYKNAHCSLKLRCNLGHIFTRLWDDFYNRNANVCPDCRKKGYI